MQRLCMHQKALNLQEIENLLVIVKVKVRQEALILQESPKLEQGCIEDYWVDLNNKYYFKNMTKKHNLNKKGYI